MATDTQILKGTVTTDGAGAGSVSIVTTGYRVRAIRVRNISLTGGTISAKDNGGLGAERLPATAQPVNGVLRSTVFTLGAVTSPLNIVIAGGGATKAFRYEVQLKR